MTRKKINRNQSRNRSSKNNQEDSNFPSMLLGAMLYKGLKELFFDKDDTKKPSNASKEVKDNDCAQNVVDVPTDGTAVEFPVQEGFEIFISEEGKPMVRRKVERKEEKDGSPITYEDIAKDLYRNVRHIYFWDGRDDDIHAYDDDNDRWQDLSNCMSEAQVKRLMAFNKLQNIAIWLNDGWKPKFYDNSDKSFIYYDDSDGGFKVAHNTYCNNAVVYFKTSDLAEQAIAIMGEESLKDLFSTDW